MRHAFLRRLSVLLGLIFAVTPPAWAVVGPVTIDDFHTTVDGPVVAPAGPTTSTATGGSDIVGTRRDLRVGVISPASPAPGTNDVTAQVTASGLTFSSAPATQGELEIQWDATFSKSGTITPTGLGGVNLTGAGANAFKVTAASASAGTLLLLEAWTDATHSSTRALVLPAVGTPTDFVLSYAGFAPNRGTGADFTSIGALRLFVRGTNVGVTLTQIVTVAGTAAMTAQLTDNTTSTTPGSTLNYTATVKTAGADAAGVTYTDTLDANTTLTGTLRVSPVALDDAYASGTNPAVVGAPGVLQNDVDAMGLTKSVSASDTTTSLGGSVSVASNGGFSYTPPSGWAGRPDTFGYTLADSTLDGLVDTAVVTVTVTSAPVLTAGATLSFTEGDPASVIDAGITVSDVDSPMLTAATVQITGNYSNADDVLGFVDTANIAGSFDASTGTLTLTGTDTVANYQAALRSVTYANASQHPSGLARTVTWKAKDELAFGAPATSTIFVFPVNDAPTFVSIPDNIHLLEGTNVTTAAHEVVVDDVDSGTGTLTLTAVTTFGTLSLSGTGITILNNGTTNVTVTGQLADLNTITAVFTPTAHHNDTRGNATVVVTVNDNGNTGSGGALQVVHTINISFDPVNDPPVIGSAGLIDRSGTAIPADSNFSVPTVLPNVSDPDTGDAGFTAAFTLTAASCPGCVVTNLNGAAGTFDVQPPPGFTGTLDISITVQDNGNPAPGRSTVGTLRYTVS